jgi:alpha/beta hydrolase fold
LGPTGETRIRIVRPASAGSTARLPVILYTHGGGWVLGDKITHDRLVREIANGVGATVIRDEVKNRPDPHDGVAGEAHEQRGANCRLVPDRAQRDDEGQLEQR